MTRQKIRNTGRDLLGSSYQVYKKREKEIEWKPQPGGQQLLMDCKADVIFYGGAAGSGKEESCPTLSKGLRSGLSFMEVQQGIYNGNIPLEKDEMKVLDWKGDWIPMSLIKAGDRIINPDGQTQKVLQVFEQGFKNVFRVTFEDDTYVDCGEEHLWGFWEARVSTRRKTKVTGTREVYSNLTPEGWNKNYISRARVEDTGYLKKEIEKGRKFLIPVNAPLNFTGISRGSSDRAYIYGLMIGDGCFSVQDLSSHVDDTFIHEEVRRITEGRSVEKVYESRPSLKRISLRKVPWFKRWLNNEKFNKLKSNNKRLPNNFQRASLAYRYNLAQGLFDTDGYVGKNKREVSYTTVSKQLAEDVAVLVRTLGYLAKIKVKSQAGYKDNNGNFVKCQDAYTVYVEGNHLELLFRLPRKKQRAINHGKFNGGNSWIGKAITKIEKLPEKEYCRCILVSGANSLYITDGYNVTHNTSGLLMRLAAPKAIKTRGYIAGIFRKTRSEITNPGGILDDSKNLYRKIGGKLTLRPLDWKWKDYDSKICFRQIQHDNDKHIYQGSQFCLLCFDELTHFCLKPSVDVLTENGWKKITEVVEGEKVASYSKDRKIEYKKAKLVSFNYKGEMLKAENKSLSMTMTPNHRIVQDKQLSVSKKKKGEFYGDWRFKKAKESYSKDIRVPRNGIYQGKNIEYYQIEKVEGRGIGKNANTVERVSMNEWLRFLGWYFSEGCAFENNNKNAITGKGSPRVSIRQTKEEHKEEIRQVFDSLGYSWKETKDGQFNIHSRQLYRELIQFGKGAKEKRIPRWLFKLSREQIQIFLKAFEKGDGYRGKSNEMQIGLCNEGLIDDLQELYFLTGNIATKRYHRTKTGFDVYNLYVREARTKVQNTTIKKHQWSKEQYEGKVHCLQVEDNHTFLVRDKGNYFWTGNSEDVFFYMLSRNRSGCGIKPTVIATCNPDADSWVANFIDWWIDQETGLPVKERRGVIRYFVRENENIHWADTKKELIDRFGDEANPKSFTFIYATLEDNPILMKKNPEYIGNLKALHPIEQARLLYGNWKIRLEAGVIFETRWFKKIKELPEHRPEDIVKVRFWDLAATDRVSATVTSYYTASVLIYKIGEYFYIVDVTADQVKGGDTIELIKETARLDGEDVRIRFEEEGGATGKTVPELFREALLEQNPKYDVQAVKPSTNKISRAIAPATGASKGFIYILDKPWNPMFMEAIQEFDGSRKPRVNDIIDSLSGCYNDIKNAFVFDFSDTYSDMERSLVTEDKLRRKYKTGFAQVGNIPRSIR